jgi:hypothetical protein
MYKFITIVHVNKYIGTYLNKCILKIEIKKIDDYLFLFFCIYSILVRKEMENKII